MTVIRLQPQGKKFQRTYRVVVDSKRAKLGGKNIEDLGWLNRHTNEYKLNEERVKYWLGVGAQPSDTVYNLFVNAGLIEGKKRSVHSKKKVSAEDIEKMEEAEDKSPEDTPEESQSENGESSKEEKEEEDSNDNDKESKKDDSEDSEESDSEEDSESEDEEDEESDDSEDEEEEKEK